MSAENIDFNIRVNVQNAEQAWNASRRLLYSLNAIRLSIVDIEKVFRGPTLGNVLWTAIQIQRTFTHIKRLQDAVVAKQATSVGLGLAQGAQSIGGKTLGGVVKGVGSTSMTQMMFGQGGQLVAPSTTGLFGALSAFLATPLGAVTAGVVVAGVAVGGKLIYDKRAEERKDRWFQMQREQMIQQGLEPF